MVVTKISDAVPITMPSAVRAKRTLLLRKVSQAKVNISPRARWARSFLRVVVAVCMLLNKMLRTVGGRCKLDSTPNRYISLTASVALTQLLVFF